MLMGTEKRVVEAEVIAVPDVEFTKTWHPVHHRDVISTLAESVNSYGMEIETKEYSITRNGLNMFGVWKLVQKENGMQWSIGLRNSMQKQMAIGVCAGTNVMVCDNMAFSGEFMNFRRHTGKLDIDELRVFCEVSTSNVIDKIAGMCKWQKSLREHHVPEDEFKVLTYDMLKNNVFPPSKFRQFIDAHQEERTIDMENDPNLYNVHGAVTRLLRNDSMFSISSKTTRLNQVCNWYMDDVTYI